MRKWTVVIVIIEDPTLPFEPESYTALVQAETVQEAIAKGREEARRSRKVKKADCMHLVTFNDFHTPAAYGWQADGQ